jgi:Zn-dependent protease
MLQSWKLFSVFRIPVKFHWSFLLLIAYFVYQNFVLHAYEDFTHSFHFLIIAYLSIVLHEFGHAFTARFLRYDVDSIVITPLSGAAIIKNLSGNLIHELIVVFAGPMVNFTIYTFVGIYFYLFSDYSNQFQNVFLYQKKILFFDDLSIFLFDVMRVNGILFILNLLPILPIDGGRILRAILMFFTNKKKATIYTIVLGIIFAILLITYFDYKLQGFDYLFLGFLFLINLSELRLLKPNE